MMIIVVAYESGCILQRHLPSLNFCNFLQKLRPCFFFGPSHHYLPRIIGNTSIRSFFECFRGRLRINQILLLVSRYRCFRR